MFNRTTITRRQKRLRALIVILAMTAITFPNTFADGTSGSVGGLIIGNVLRGAPCGIAWVVNNDAAFVMDTGGPYVAGTAAPDDSYHLYKFRQGSANVTLEWGRVGDNVVGRISSDQQIDLKIMLSSGWPNWTSTFSGTADGATGVASSGGGQVNWTLKTSPAPTSSSSSNVTVSLAPDSPVKFVAGLSSLPDFASVDDTLEKAQEKYSATRPQASGDWGDFVGAIADNMNNSKLYANNNHMLAHSVSRHWSGSANGSPYFCWDSFFTANLAALDDPVVARNTVRAILSCQSPEGLVPNFGHWDRAGGTSMDRSQPPVGSLCVWKMHQRYPDDLDFLKEVYPKFVLWHDWWPKYRNAKGDDLLEWGSSNKGDFQAAQYETGWDDNLHYQGAAMDGATMNCYSVDLSSMWAMDAHYMALLADALGQTADAVRFRKDEADMNKRINDKLWNDNLNTYCSRYWDDVETQTRVDSSAFGAGFDGEYFTDENLQNSAGSHHDDKIDFNWRDKPPIDSVPSGDHWSARWKGTFTPPTTGSYRFSASADDGVRVIVNGNTVIDDWSIHGAREKTADMSLTQGQSVPVVVEYYQHEQGSELHFFVTQMTPTHGAFLTRLTPMNFYPLSSGAPDADRAKRVLSVLTDPTKFWGQYLLPTLAYDDPDWHIQEYWRGDIWGPTNYITWVGIKKYASPGQIAEFADRSVELFMREWLAHGVCSENYLSTDGTHNHDPHYTWGALLDLIGLESIVDVDDSGQIVLNGTMNKNITLSHIPLLGKYYDVKVTPGLAVLTLEGKTILTASGKVARLAPH
jgi:glycogen debranching enzyme